MIIEFGFKNFASFKEGCHINFAFDGNVPTEVKNGREFAAVLGIKGANGSGKTNIIKALEFLRFFCMRSSELDNNEEIPLIAFYKNTEPCEFYIEFETQGNRYIYELEVTRKMVFRETIYRCLKRKTKILERIEDQLATAIDELKELELIQLKSNSSILSMLNKYKFKSPMNDLVLLQQFFLKILTNVHYFGYYDRQMDDSEISKAFSLNPQLFEFVKNVVRMADSGIIDIAIFSRRSENSQEIFYPVFLHANGEEKCQLLLQDESSGTQTLFRKMYFYWLVLTSGGILAFDEFDIHIHAMILPKMLELFTNPQSNQTDAQFIFTAHNTEIIDNLGKYRTILVNKEDNESYCYRLDEIPGSMVRNDRSIIPLYLQGKIGGIPHV